MKASTDSHYVVHKMGATKNCAFETDLPTTNVPAQAQAILVMSLMISPRFETCKFRLKIYP